MGIFSGSGDSRSGGSVELKKFNNDFKQLLIDGEMIDAGFTVLRDTLLFTSKRLIFIDVQGISGRQLEYLSVPYTKITKFSVQTGSAFDLNAELKIWVGSDTIPIEKKFNKDLDIYAVQKILASHLLK